MGCGWGSALISAQTPNPSVITSSLAAVKGRVPAGSDVYVTDATGATMKGQLAEVTDDAVRLNVGGRIRSVVAADLQRIQWEQHDSVLSGVLIGAGLGAIPGIYWLVVDPNECRGMCPEEYALVAAGALMGGLIDHAIKHKVTVYERGSFGARRRSLTISPVFARGRIGGHLALRF
jgi:hypothetical protein